MAAAYLDALNPEQRRGVEHGIEVGRAQAAKPLLIIAGAGSGKTNTLAHRVAHLIVNGADPRRILLMTFSRRAASERTRRVERIGRRVLGDKALTASAGVSYNKFLAKLASDQRKPHGQFAITAEEGPAFVEALTVAKFHGVGPATAARMHAAGIHTGADLMARSLDELKHRFGKAGGWYYAIARGQDERPVNPSRERKSSGSETTFSEDLTDPAQIEAGVLAMADDVWAWCEKTGERGRTATVKIKWSDFQQSTRSRAFSTPIASRAALHEASLGLIRSVYPPKGIRLVGVRLSKFGGESAPDDKVDLVAAAPVLAKQPPSA